MWHTMWCIMNYLVEKFNKEYVWKGNSTQSAGTVSALFRAWHLQRHSSSSSLSSSLSSSSTWSTALCFPWCMASWSHNPCVAYVPSQEQFLHPVSSAALHGASSPWEDLIWWTCSCHYLLCPVSDKGQEVLLKAGWGWPTSWRSNPGVWHHISG